ncbi:MAG: outer membrane protein assembly factor BamD [Candidatus Omnitrophica bacterium]|nr:outer membrane protein assembly factor BamD [Candidatus Omnitrophota bacterium]
MKRAIFMLIISGFCLSSPKVYPYWIWTPKTQKWINPKATPKSTPKEQLDFAMSIYDMKKYEDAKREFDKILKFYPKSLEAAESQYYLGLIEEAEENLYEAYQAYQKTIDKYPFSERIPEIIEREYKIAEAFMSGVKRKAMGIVLPVENPAIEILTKVIDNSTFGTLAAKAQYKLGLVLKSLSRYYEAEDAFNKVLSNYHDSEWVDAAKFQIASCRAAISRGPDYDRGSAKEAQQKFEDFIEEHPDAVLSRDAEKNIEQLKEKEAEGNYNIGRFYEKQKALDAAKVYYNDVINNYPESPWAAKALERMQVMDKKK